MWSPEDFFADSSTGLAVFTRVCELLDPSGPYDVRVTKSQVGLRRARGFAWIWLPGRHLGRPDAEVVVSIALGRHDGSPRFKEVVHPSPLHWMHHLEVDGPDDLDEEAAAWLREAYERAG